MNSYPSAIYPISYNVSHEPYSREKTPLPTYKIVIRSSRNTNEGLDDWNKVLTFKIGFDDSMPMQNDADYQLAVESFYMYHDSTSHHVHPICLHAIGNRALNVSDCYTSYAGVAANTDAGRSDVIAVTHVDGVFNSITPDTIGIPCQGLNIFTNKAITLQVRKIYGSDFTAAEMGVRTTYKYGDWVAMLVLYPKIK